jgi:hypothetical protein
VDQRGSDVGEILDVGSLGSFETQDFVMEKAVPCVELVVNGVEALELRGLRSQFCGEAINLRLAGTRVPVFGCCRILLVHDGSCTSRRPPA